MVQSQESLFAKEMICLGFEFKRICSTWQGSEWIQLSGFLQVFEFGHINRATECTCLNEHSSRSHALLIVAVRGVNYSTGMQTTGWYPRWATDG